MSRTKCGSPQQRQWQADGHDGLSVFPTLAAVTDATWLIFHFLPTRRLDST